jgi:hypothetical protein
MDLANMQDSKKTIIAFAAGLLIGALLVWAFMAATPAEDRENNVNDDDNGLVGNNTNRDDDDDNTSSTNGSRNDDDTETFSIDDQPAGNTVELGNIDFPEGTGWVAVTDYEDGVAGSRFLGAALYDTDAGLEPTQIELLRATEAGKTYRVSFFEDNGDREFSRAGGDTEIEGEAAIFRAE